MQAYTDASKANDPHALPDVEVFYRTAAGYWCNSDGVPMASGWYYWHSASDPSGPYASEAEALAAAREAAGFCAHGVSDEQACEECPAPELWVLRFADGTFARAFESGRTDDSRNAMAWVSADAAQESGARMSFCDGGEPYRLPDAEARAWGSEPCDSTTVRCAVCGEESGSTGSMSGTVHKWGPRDHHFEPTRG